jgi:cystathionine beta-lyase family protein involved in aluminum resistance
MNGEEIVCKTFFDKLGHQSQMIRIAERLNAVQFVEQNNNEKLISYASMTNRGKSL